LRYPRAVSGHYLYLDEALSRFGISMKAREFMPGVIVVSSKYIHDPTKLVSLIARYTRC
jgi:hypothetical protein